MNNDYDMNEASQEYTFDNLSDFETPEDELISNDEYKHLVKCQKEVQRELKSR